MKNNQKGVAIIAAVFIITLIVWIASELTYETSVEYSIHARSIQKLQAYHTARSGIELSLLRLMIFKNAKKQFGAQLGPQSAALNLIWSFPLVWPPVALEDVSVVDKDEIKDTVETSTLKGNFLATIIDEGSKLDINDLGSPSEKVREITKQRLTQLLQEQIIADKDFAELNRNVPVENLISHIKDWVDPDQESSIGGDEKSFYPNSNQLLPPNRSFRSLDELQQVKLMTPSIFDFLKNKITVYGQKAINPNTASAEILKSLDISLTDQIVGEIISRRDNPLQGGPFQNQDEFWGFANGRGARVTTEKQAEIPMIFDNVMSFRIRSSAEFKSNNHTIEVVVWDFPQIVESLADQVSKEIMGPGPSGEPPKGPNQTSGQGNGLRQDNRPPPIVYWSEQ